jgi:hypothetical protein
MELYRFKTIEAAEHGLQEVVLDVTADQGEDAVEAAWRDLVEYIAADSTPAVRAELMRRNGFDLR